MMPGMFGGGQNAQPKQPFGPQLKQALITAAPMFNAMAAGYASGRGPYAYMDQGAAGVQAMLKQKRDEEAAAAAAAAFGGLMTPGGLGMSSKGGGTGSGAPGGYYGASADPGFVLGVDALPQSPTTPGGYSMGTEIPQYIPDEVKNGIFAGESGGDYNALFGFSNRDGGKFSNVKLSDMTIDQALAFADPSGPYGQWVKGQVGRVATPMGAYQIVGTTLRAAKEALGLTGNERMTPELQDRLGGWIYANQGTGAWEGYRGPQAAPEGGWGGGNVTMSAKGEGASGPVDPMADPYVQKLMGVMAMPGLRPEQRAVVEMQLQSRIQMLTTPQPGAEEAAVRAQRARDAEMLGLQPGTAQFNQYVVTGQTPEAPKPIEVGGVLLDPITKQVIFDSRQPKEGARPMTAQERAAWGIPETDTTPYKMTENGPVAIGGGDTIIDMGGGGKFEEAFAKGDAATVETVYNAGLQAQRNLARIDQLDALLSANPTGAGAAITQFAGSLGIQTEGLDEIQAAQALINSLVPEQRQPGSGPMSDADLALFKQSLPQIINSPGGNKIIVDTMRAIAEYDAEGARIVQRLRNGELTRAQAFDALQNRANPLANYSAGASQGATQPIVTDDGYTIRAIE